MASPGEVGFYDKFWDDLIDHVANALRVGIQGNVTLAGPITVDEIQQELPAGNEHIGKVSGQGDGDVTTILGMGAALHAAGDAVGTLVEITNAARVAGGRIRINTITISDLALQAGGFNVIFGNQTFTQTADNDPMSPADAQISRLAHVPLTAGEFVDFANNRLGTKRNVGLELTLAGTSLFYQMMAADAYTPGTANDLIVRVEWEQIS